MMDEGCMDDNTKEQSTDDLVDEVRGDEESRETDDRHCQPH